MDYEYSKPALDSFAIIEKLKANGLTIIDEKEAYRKLGLVSYFRKAAYLQPMEENKQSHKFKTGSTFENAVALYEFDTKLRQLLFTAIQEIEIALRTKIIQHFSLKHGPFWFMDITLADNERLFVQNLSALDRELERSREDFIKEHFKKYKKPTFPPSWKTLELASLGTLSKLYYNFSDKNVRRQLHVSSTCQTMRSLKAGCAMWHH